MKSGYGGIKRICPTKSLHHVISKMKKCIIKKSIAFEIHSSHLSDADKNNSYLIKLLGNLANQQFLLTCFVNIVISLLYICLFMVRMV